MINTTHASNMVYSRTEEPGAGKKPLTAHEAEELAKPTPTEDKPNFADILAKGFSQPSTNNSDALELGEPAMSAYQAPPMNPAILAGALASLNNSNHAETSQQTSVIDSNTLANAANFAQQRAETQNQISQARNAIDSLPPGPQKQQALSRLASVDPTNPAQANEILSSINQLIGESGALNLGASHNLADNAARARDEERRRLDEQWETLQKDLYAKALESGLSEEEAEAFTKDINAGREEAITHAKHANELSEEATALEASGQLNRANQLRHEAEKEVAQALEIAEQTGRRVTDVTGDERLGKQTIDLVKHEIKWEESTQTQTQDIAMTNIDQNIAEAAKQALAITSTNISTAAQPTEINISPEQTPDSANSPANDPKERRGR